MLDAPQLGSVVTIAELSNEKFVIGKVLRGGMGEVYQLLPVAPVGPVLALKTYQQTATREQFIREADLWISLGNHAHIARALLYLEWQSQPSIIAEWYKQTIDNQTAETWPTAKLINFAAGLLDGLEYALRVQGMIHQDVKPANILLDEKDEPRLTDFGMARFANAGLPIRSVEGVDASMVQSVSLGPIGGTPFYMAPELFVGCSPSAQTDIFSLGITLYQITTGEHPYCGPETRHRMHPVFRLGPLRRFEQKRGREASSLVSLIVAASQLDPRNRPHSYDALFRLIGREYTGAQSPGSERVRDIITKAAFLRDTGRMQDALELLRAAMTERPTNPELLNTFAILLLKLGYKQRAYAAWDSAVECLEYTKGRHERSLYLDPAINLAWRMVSEQQYAKADSLFTRAAQWSEESRAIQFSYAEFGWWHLYHGRFTDAWQHLSASSKSKTLDEMSIWCFTLAAWMSGQFETLADSLAQAYLNLQNGGAATALLACVIATLVQGSKQTKLRALAYPQFESQLAEAAKDIGLSTADLLRSMPSPAIHMIMRSLDGRVTGGKNIGHI
ncbi:MAG TPA: protein kinase [Edaphobacter sp.]|uniref:serine/threonine-protein kinase n=1 Tax=Edaphobacter sp. TaxID=1934404 RepID=UPI002CB76284|nr:protein kinase [Edaphobacter sp.]HUZ94407.1 protein kinase [Edaphobacter sp.]